jgi:AcrR family transcriptional regulator
MKKRAIQFEDKENKRKQIVIAARELFTVRDFFFVKMEDVATKAGVAKGTHESRVLFPVGGRGLT